MQRLRYSTFIAALGMTATFFIHVFLGGPEVHIPIQASALPDGLRAISAVLWHMVSVELAFFALMLFLLAAGPVSLMLERMLAGMQIGFAALFIFYGLKVLGNVTQMPQWIIFLTLAALILWGTRQDSPK